MKQLCGVILALALVGCSSAPRRIPITAVGPSRAVVVILDDPAASAFLVAQESEKLAKKIIRLLAKNVDSARMKAVESCSVDELVARVCAWLHIDRIPPDAVTDVNEFFGTLPGSIKDDLLEALGIDDFDVTPTEMKRGAHKTYALIAWAPGYKAKVKTINPIRNPEDINFNLERK